MRFENIIIMLASSVALFASVSGDLCSESRKLRKIRNNQTINWSERQKDYNKYDTVAIEELRYCDEGYSERFCNEYEIVCEPECPAGCENGTCKAPGICACAEGFELRSNAENIECVPLIKNNDMRYTKGLALTIEVSKDLDICREACYCWKKDLSDLCSVLCGSEKNQCLEPEFSFCNETDKSIVYKKNVESGKVYMCAANRTLTSYYRTDFTTESLWLIIGGSIFIGIMLIAIVYLCVRIYQTRHETGAHDIPISLLMKF